MGLDRAWHKGNQNLTLTFFSFLLFFFNFFFLMLARTLQSSWYSSISLSSLSLDKETKISAIYKKALKKKTLDEKGDNT